MIFFKNWLLLIQNSIILSGAGLKAQESLGLGKTTPFSTKAPGKDVVGWVSSAQIRRCEPCTWARLGSPQTGRRTAGPREPGLPAPPPPGTSRRLAAGLHRERRLMEFASPAGLEGRGSGAGQSKTSFQRLRLLSLDERALFPFAEFQKSGGWTFLPVVLLLFT